MGFVEIVENRDEGRVAWEQGWVTSSPRSVARNISPYTEPFLDMHCFPTEYYRRSSRVRVQRWGLSVLRGSGHGNMGMGTLIDGAAGTHGSGFGGGLITG